MKQKWSVVSCFYLWHKMCLEVSIIWKCYQHFRHQFLTIKEFMAQVLLFFIVLIVSPVFFTPHCQKTTSRNYLLENAINIVFKCSFFVVQMLGIRTDCEVWWTQLIPCIQVWCDLPEIWPGNDTVITSFCDTNSGSSLIKF